jgi:hypothetical protein
MSRVLVFFLTFLAASSICQAQAVPSVSEIRVLVLDYKTGRPVKGREVEVMLPDVMGQIHNRSPLIVQKTRKDGIASVQVPSPLPPQLWVMADFPCTRQQAFATTEILQHGIVGDHADFELCKNPTSRRVAARPGQIVLYIRRLNPWLRLERLVWEIFES